MRNLTLDVDNVAFPAEIAITSCGAESIAVAALLAARKINVSVRTGRSMVPSTVRIDSQPEQVVDRQLLSVWRDSHDDSFSRNSILVVSARSPDYHEAIDWISEALHPGHTIFILDAPLLAAFELSCRLEKLGKKIPLAVVEMSSLFGRAEQHHDSIRIERLRDQVPICGRTINETRAGVSIARRFCDKLIPASNPLERVLSDCGHLLRAALKLFVVMGTTGSGESREKLSFTQAELSVLQAMEAELQSFGRCFNVAVGSGGVVSEEPGESPEDDRRELAAAVGDNLVLISDLARVAYHPVPTVDSVIELASITLGRDLRKEGRRLEDTGLIGMDGSEIVELINS